MGKTTFLALLLLSLFSACLPLKSIRSTTYIKGNDAFILGKNEHGKFRANVTNTSKTEITLWQCPLAGGQHSPIVLQHLSSASVKMDKSSFLKIENRSSEEVSVKLKVTGDVGLSMGYLQ